MRRTLFSFISEDILDGWFEGVYGGHTDNFIYLFHGLRFCLCIPLFLLLLSDFDEKDAI